MERVVVAGGGVLGTMHALAARRRGLGVVHLEREPGPRGASVRTFGLIWVNGRAAGPELSLALRARAGWEELAAAPGRPGTAGCRAARRSRSRRTHCATTPASGTGATSSCSAPVQRLDGSFTIGDTHSYTEPFAFDLDEDAYDHLRSVAERLLGSPLPPVQRRWAGVYSQATGAEMYHRSEIAPGVILVTGPGGRGMTCAPAIAEETFA